VYLHESEQAHLNYNIQNRIASSSQENSIPWDSCQNPHLHPSFVCFHLNVSLITPFVYINSKFHLFFFASICRKWLTPPSLFHLSQRQGPCLVL
jgi:hypothetical protein